MFRLGATDSELVVRDHDEGALPGFDRLALEDGIDSTDQCLSAWRAKSHEQEPFVRARRETADVGKVQILRDEEAPICLGRRPDIGVGLSRQTFLRNGIGVVA